MKKTIVLGAICIAATLLTQCHKKMAPAASVSPKEEVAEMNKKYNSAQIAQGKTIFTSNCGKCHDLHQPPEFAVKEWDKILPKMCKKAELAPDEAGMVRAYVITNAKEG